MKKILGLFAALAMLLSLNSQAGDFAEEKIVLQISDPNPFKQTLVLNVASNVLKHYGQDKVEIEIVAFGPGLRLLFEENANKGRIKALSSSGVKFSACKNTIRNMSKKLGHAPALHKAATPVGAGVVQIVDLMNKGYKLVKP